MLNHGGGSVEYPGKKNTGRLPPTKPTGGGMLYASLVWRRRVQCRDVARSQGTIIEANIVEVSLNRVRSARVGSNVEPVRLERYGSAGEERIRGEGHGTAVDVSGDDTV